MLIKTTRIPVLNMILVGFWPSFLKKFYYRRKGYFIGKNVSIGLGSIILSQNVEIGNNTSIGYLTIIRAKIIRIGRFVKIGSLDFIDTEKFCIDDDSKINENVIIAGLKFPDSEIIIGKRTIIMEYSYLNPTRPLHIGDDTGIGGHCLLFTHSSWSSQLDGYPVTFAPIKLGKKVWLPWRVFIMPGVEIGDEVVIGANSLVSKSIPSNSLAAGSPAKVIKENFPSPLSDEKRANILSNIFDSFENHLVYNNFEIIRDNIEVNNFSIAVSNNKKKSILCYFSSKKEIGKSSFSDSLLVLDFFEEDYTKYLKNYKMIINLISKERIGTSDIGEEFARFVSRYGLRFNRKD